jgi:hypothetical protein
MRPGKSCFRLLGMSHAHKLPASAQGAAPDDRDTGGLISTVSKLLVLYAVYVFISGWAFLDYYYRYYGVDTRWLDLTTYDILIKGFTVLFTGGWLLWPLYVVLIALPLIAERKLQNRIWSVLAITATLLAILLAVYVVSTRAGEKIAQADKSDNTTLPSIIFRSRASKLQYHGKLLGFRSGVYLVHGVALVPGQNSLSADTPGGSSDLELSMIRGEDITEITVIEHQ